MKLVGMYLWVMLSFCTGSKYPPPLGFDEPITVRFDPNSEWPLASTCALQLTLPSKFHNNSSKFKDKLFLLCSIMAVLDFYE